MNNNQEYPLNYFEGNYTNNNSSFSINLENKSFSNVNNNHYDYPNFSNEKILNLTYSKLFDNSENFYNLEKIDVSKLSENLNNTFSNIIYNENNSKLLLTESGLEERNLNLLNYVISDLNNLMMIVKLKKIGNFNEFIISNQSFCLNRPINLKDERFIENLK